MALFEGYKRVEGSRSNTALIKSGHMSPAEEWILDPTFKDSSMAEAFDDGVLFKYQYGGPGMEDVVIPKGRLVGVGKSVKDFVSKKYKTIYTLPGLATNSNVIGMAPYNITKDYFQQDRFGGNQPTIITLDYVTLPYMPGVTVSTSTGMEGLIDEEKRISKAMKMPWGAVIGSGIVPGDYLKTTPSGRLTKWIKGTDNPMDVVGQVLAEDMNQEPWGWMKWMLANPSLRKDSDAFMNRSGASNLPSDNGYPFDPQYVEGNTTFQQFQSRYVDNPSGLPGLHDGFGDYPGYGINDNTYTDIKIGTAPTKIDEDSIKMAFTIKDASGYPMKNIVDDSTFEIKLDGTKVDDDDVTDLSFKNGEFILTIPKAKAGKDVTVSYHAIRAGIPTYLDFKGVVGSFNILLKR